MANVSIFSQLTKSQPHEKHRSAYLSGNGWRVTGCTQWGLSWRMGR